MAKSKGSRLIRLLVLAAYWVLGPTSSVLFAHHSPLHQAPAPPPTDLNTIEKEMAAHPLESFVLARQAADRMTNRPEVIKQIFATAARLQEEKLPLLTESQVEELAEAKSKVLGAPKAAEEIRRRWLTIREKALGSADGPGRLKLAQFYYKWLKDRDAAARLCKEAFHVAPELAAVGRMLREELGYQLTELGWQPRNEGGEDGPGRGTDKIRSGMTAAQVRQILGKPSRTARQILYRRYREQWFYDNLPGYWIDFDCFKGHDPHVLTVHMPQSER
jgi:hypothetical protein